MGGIEDSSEAETYVVSGETGDGKPIPTDTTMTENVESKHESDNEERVQEVESRFEAFEAEREEMVNPRELPTNLEEAIHTGHSRK